MTDATAALLRTIAQDPYAFWTQFYAQKFGALNITIPPLPRLSRKIRERIDDGSLLPIFLPTTLTQDDYPEDWIKSDWGRFIDDKQITHHPLPGRWVVIELVYKPDWYDPLSYGGGNDLLARELNLKTRFRLSLDHLRANLYTQTVELWDLKKSAVRSLFAEEWNHFGNILLELNRLHGTQFQNLGATASWEWTQNAYGSVDRVFVGYRGHGGLAAVDRGWSGHPSVNVGFRLLGVL